MQQAAATPVKVTPPQTPILLEREALYRRLDEAAPIVWVQAAPGSGKSWLLAGYLRSREPAALWYRLDARDADPATFFHYLGLGLARVALGAEEILPAFGPEYLATIDAFSRDFFERMFAGMPRPFRMVLDDFQELPADTPTLNVLRHGLEVLPAGGRVTILSREGPPAELARFRAGGSLRVLDPGDLAFTAEEVGKLAALHGHPEPDPRTLRTVTGLTEGWAAGTVLMLADLPDPPDPATDPEPSPQAAFDFFATETFQHLDPDLRRFLTIIAVLPTATASIAQELSGQREARDWLDDLVGKGHFVLRYGSGENSRYQLHPLFRAFLLERLREELPPQERAALSRRAGELLLRDGQFEEALPLLQETGSWETLAAEIRARAGQLLDQGRHQTLIAWIEAVPQDLRAGDPWLEYWLGMSRLPADPPRARPALERAFGGFEETGNPAGLYLAWSGVVDSLFLESRDYHALDAWLDTLDALMDRFPDLPSGEVEAGVIRGAICAMTFRRPQHPDRAAWEERAERQAFDPERSAEERLTVGTKLLLFLIFWGDPRRADSIAEVLAPLAEGKDVRPLARANWHVVYGALFSLLGHLDDIREEAEAARREMRQHEIPLWELHIGGHEAYADLAAGRFQAAGETLDRIAGMLDPARLFDAHHLQLLRSRHALETGSPEAAYRHASQGLELARQVGGPAFMAFAHAQLGWVAAARGDLEEVGRRTEELELLIRDTGSRGIWKETLLLRAFLAMETDRERLPGLLGEAFGLARRSHGLAPYLWHRPLLARLCAEALESGIETDYVRDLIRRFRLEADPSLAEYEAWPRPLRIYVLGSLRILRDGEAVRFTGKAQKRPLELLTALIALGGTEVSQQALTEALWPDADGDAGQQAFATTLHRLRKLIGGDALRLQGGRLTLDPARAWVDAWALERKLDRLEGFTEAPGRLRTLVQELMDLYQGPFLPGEEAPWALSGRERLRSRFLRTLLAAAEHLSHLGKAEDALTAYRKVLEVEPLAESAYRGLMALFLHLGRPAEGLAVYQQCRDQLGRRLNIAPSPPTEALRRELQDT